jgi:hypothetical protein
VSDFRASEYEALRATIRERGTARLCALLAGVGLWGFLALRAYSGPTEGAALFVPFLILAATFEINFFIHTGVERIGRYIQVFHEDASGAAGWETTAMHFGARFPGGTDPLFAVIFFLAALVNVVSAISNQSRQPEWIAVLAAAHLAFSYRIVNARKLAGSQRALDLERFQKLISK